MLHAMEQIRRMRGGAQSHLMRCSDGRDHDLYYVVKFQNNPQHSRVLVMNCLVPAWRRGWGFRCRPLR